MSEKNLWKWLKPYCPLGRYTRVENPDAGPGTPDVNYRISKAEGWIELKDARSKKPTIPFPNEDVGLHRTQLNWIKDQVLFNGIVWVVARVSDQIFWVPGKYADSFNGGTMRRLRGLSALVIDSKAPHLSVRRIKELLEGSK
jgi:hypothetical protein